MRYSEPNIKYNIGFNNPKGFIVNLKEPLAHCNFIGGRRLNKHNVPK